MTEVEPRRQSASKLKYLLTGSSRRIEGSPTHLEGKSGVRSLNISTSREKNENKLGLSILHVRNELKTIKYDLNRSSSRGGSQEKDVLTSSQRNLLPSVKDRFVPVEAILKAHEDEIKSSNPNNDAKKTRYLFRSGLGSQEKPDKKRTYFISIKKHSEKASQLSLGKLFVTDPEEEIRRVENRRKSREIDDPLIERQKNIFKQKPVKNQYDSLAHLKASENQYTDFVKRTKKTGWVRYPPNVVTTGLNYFDFYFALKGQRDLDFLRNDHSKRTITKDLTDSVVDKSEKKTRITEDDEKYKEKIKHRLDLRVEKEAQDRKKTIKELRIKQKLIKALTLDKVDPDPNLLRVHVNANDTELTDPVTSRLDNSDDIDTASFSVSKRQIPDSPLASRKKPTKGG